MWEAIAYVSSGLTLTAFLASVAAWIYKNKSEEKERIIRNAPESDRASLALEILGFLKLDTKNLSKEQRYNLAIEQIHARTIRYRTSALVIALIAILAAVISYVAISKDIESSVKVDSSYTNLQSCRCSLIE